VGLAPPVAKAKSSAKPAFYQISAVDAAKIRTSLEQLRKAISKLKEQPKLEPLIDQIEALLPENGGSSHR
jgi:hypothetical protein